MVGLEPNSYHVGEIYFLETYSKGDSIYVSYNENHEIDALVVEVSKQKSDSVMFALTELLFASYTATGENFVTNTRENVEKFRQVILGERSYFDIYADKLGAYLRVKNTQEVRMQRGGSSVNVLYPGKENLFVLKQEAEKLGFTVSVPALYRVAIFRP